MKLQVAGIRVPARSAVIHLPRMWAMMSVVAAVLGVAPSVAKGQTTSFLENFSSNALPLELEESGGSPIYTNGTVVFPGGGDWARRYVRTLANYNAQSFVAEVTVTISNGVGPNGIAFFGLGAGQGSWFFNEPRTSPTTYVRLMPTSFGSGFGITNSDAEHIGGDPAVAGDGTHRVRLSWDSVNKTFTAAIHQNYAGGAFTPAATIVLTPDNEAYGDTNTRIFFGGAGNTTFDDLRVTTMSGTAGAIDCHGQSVSGLVRQFGSMNSAASALGFGTVTALQNVITSFCGN